MRARRPSGRRKYVDRTVKFRAFTPFPVLAGVRTPAALADLPESERQAWQAVNPAIRSLFDKAEE
jgi:hypothetical protein